MTCPDCGSTLDLYEPDDSVTESELYETVADSSASNANNYRAECSNCDWSDTLSVTIQYHWGT